MPDMCIYIYVYIHIYLTSGSISNQIRKWGVTRLANCSPLSWDWDLETIPKKRQKVKALSLKLQGFGH